MKMKIAVIPGDGIGPEIVDSSLQVLDRICEKFHHTLEKEVLTAGGCAIDQFGDPLPKTTLEKAKAADAVLLGAVGGPAWENHPSGRRPEEALLGLRGGLGLFCNLRPALLYPSLKSACPLRPDLIGGGLDLIIVRELTGGIYFGKRGRSEDYLSAYDTLSYSAAEVERLARIGFELAKKRRGKVTSVDKANILESSRLWRETVCRVARDYLDIELNHLYVDNASMQLVRDPKQFDVIVTGNMFGDILSDEASMITGSIGMLPSASLRNEGFGMYEPIHGSAPDIAGKGIANPIATILSVEMMLRYTFSLQKEADEVERAVRKVLDSPHRTPDIASEGMRIVSTREMTDLILAALG